MLPRYFVLFLLGFLTKIIRALPLEPPYNDTLPANYYFVLFCEDAYFQGKCAYMARPFEYCQPLGAEWTNRISSIQPGKNSICGLYTGTDCEGLVDQMVWPGSADLAGTMFNDASGSIKCWVSA